jgi:hypothetical protein
MTGLIRSASCEAGLYVLMETVESASSNTRTRTPSPLPLGSVPTNGLRRRVVVRQSPSSPRPASPSLLKERSSPSPVPSTPPAPPPELKKEPYPPSSWTSLIMSYLTVRY